jgi:hypothetical protein
MAVSAIKPGRLAPPFDRYDNVLGVNGFHFGAELTFLFMTLFAVLGVVAAADMLKRFLRSTGEQRQQFKWFAFVAGWVPPAMVVYIVVTIADADSIYLLDPTFPILLTSVAFAIGIAVLKYQLYDVDILIHRTLVYGALTSGLGAVYFGLVVGLQALLRPFNGGSDLAIVATTLVVAALFLPARRRVQSVVDRRFNRRHYDAARTVEAFSARLREQIDLDTLRGELAAVVGDTMQPASASLWLRPPLAIQGRNDLGTS